MKDNLKFKSISPKSFSEFNEFLENSSVETICNSGLCPNRSECFRKKHLAFLILGNICTRACKFCGVLKGKPFPLDSSEPEKIAKVVKELNLKYVVITSVTRDDLIDGGAEQFAKTVQKIRETQPDSKIETLIPDFKGNLKAIDIVINSKPFVINHNIESTCNCFKNLRPLGNYYLSLKILRYIKEKNPSILTKSGFMIGVGESLEDIKKTLEDLKKSKVDIVTIGQYLPPTKKSFELSKKYNAKEFEVIKKMASDLKFKAFFIGPKIRSSYSIYNNT